MFKLHNVRLGFATNSSSSHSIVLCDQAVEDDYDDQTFSWRFFTLASEEAKRKYVGQMLLSALMDVNGLSNYDAAIVASNWAQSKIDPNGNIDHQSVIALPHNVNYGKKQISKEFFVDFLDFILQPSVVILGGNDNDEDNHPLLQKVKNISLNMFYEERSSNIRCRYDSTGKFWSLFNTNNGKKIRVSFEEDSITTKSEVPELVDLKITNCCNSGCSFCYQNSSPGGNHADFEKVCRLIACLSEMGVFEIAVGGGEPTLHPNFVSFITRCFYDGLICNFSTRNLKWVADNICTIHNKIGAVGFSCDDPDVLVENISLIQDLIKKGIRITIQTVVGACSEYSLERMLELCNTFCIPILLLGWKNVGRGNIPHEVVKLSKLLNKYIKGGLWKGPVVSFDTVLVNDMKPWLEKHSDRLLFSIKEGSHSMYIDAVDFKMGRSSFCEEAEFVSLNSKSFTWTGDIVKFYQTL